MSPAPGANFISSSLSVQVTHRSFSSHLNYMTSKWYPEGYTYPTMPTYFGSVDAYPPRSTSSSNKVSNATADGGSWRSVSWTNPGTQPTKDSEHELVDGISYFKADRLHSIPCPLLTYTLLDWGVCAHPPIFYSNQLLQCLASRQGRQTHSQLA